MSSYRCDIPEGRIGKRCRLESVWAGSSAPLFPILPTSSPPILAWDRKLDFFHSPRHDYKILGCWPVLEKASLSVFISIKSYQPVEAKFVLCVCTFTKPARSSPHLSKFYRSFYQGPSTPAARGRWSESPEITGYSMTEISRFRPGGWEILSASLAHLNQCHTLRSINNNTHLHVSISVSVGAIWLQATETHSSIKCTGWLRGNSEWN